MTDLIPFDAVRNVVAKLGQEFLDGGSPTAANVLNLAADRINTIPAIDQAAIREAALREALKAIADLPHGKNEDVMEGDERSYRAILTLIGKKK